MGAVMRQCLNLGKSESSSSTATSGEEGRKPRARNASATAGGRARLSSARRRRPQIVARRAEDRRALPAMTDPLQKRLALPSQACFTLAEWLEPKFTKNMNLRTDHHDRAWASNDVRREQNVVPRVGCL